MRFGSQVFAKNRQQDYYLNSGQAFMSDGMCPSDKVHNRL